MKNDSKRTKSSFIFLKILRNPEIFQIISQNTKIGIACDKICNENGLKMA